MLTEADAGIPCCSPESRSRNRSPPLRSQT